MTTAGAGRYSVRPRRETSSKQRRVGFSWTLSHKRLGEYLRDYIGISALAQQDALQRCQRYWGGVDEIDRIALEGHHQEGAMMRASPEYVPDVSKKGIRHLRHAYASGRANPG